MKLKQVVLSIENSPNRLYEVTKALGDAIIDYSAQMAASIPQEMPAGSDGQDEDQEVGRD